jgi:hypothetical protein
MKIKKRINELIFKLIVRYLMKNNTVIRKNNCTIRVFTNEYYDFLVEDGIFVKRNKLWIL